MGFSFRFGKYSDLREVQFELGTLEALLYDAFKGVARSKRAIQEYYCIRVERGQQVPPPIMQFISSGIRAVHDDLSVAKEVFGHEQAKLKNTSVPMIVIDLVGLMDVEYLKGGSDIYAKIEQALNFLKEKKGLQVSESTVKEAFYGYQRRAKRLQKVSDLLGEWHDKKPNIVRQNKLKQKLDKLYKEKSMV